MLVYWYDGCVPPRVFTNNSTLSSLKSRDVEVWWRWGKGETIYFLNLQTGRWENKNDGSEPTEEDLERMIKNSREILRERAEKRRGELRDDVLDDEDDSDDDDVIRELCDDNMT
ncbi:hypothetical protein HOLleu_42438 [Holothuria leucospilota]|uniref:Uncharacterized protein n=1 Tax=Holothuria leucospilota TaxID=206669 RepID=A0A9Q1B9B5_HOLLE|nr:hypothetical protein HOLleu_42438 [Holothuria leucospilota]